MSGRFGRRWARGGAAALSAALLFSSAAAADGEAARAAAEARGKRALAISLEVYKASERMDLKRVVARLRDEDWLLRRYAAVRLRASGVPDQLVQACHGFARPGAAAPAEDDAAIQGVARWVETEEKEGRLKPLAEGGDATPGDGALGLMGIAHEHVRIARTDAVALEVADLHAALLGLVPEEESPLGARTLFAAVDREAMAAEVPFGKDLKPKDAKAIGAWYWQNRPFLYLHPKEGRLRLDAEAREKGKPTADYRKEKPWGAAEGPNAPPKEGAGGQR